MQRIGAAMLALVVLAGGCGPRLRAVPSADQIGLPMDGGAVWLTQNVTAEARPVEVPWTPRESLIAFDLVVSNTSEATLTWNPADLTLEDGEGRLRHPLPIDALAQSYGAAGGNRSQTPRLEPDRFRDRSWWRPWPGTAYDWAYRYPPYSYPSPYRGAPYLAYHALTMQASVDPDPLWERRRAAAFLMQVPGPCALAPGDTVSGCVVFSCPLEPGAELVLSLPLPDTSGPADALVPLQMRFVYQ